MPRFSERYAFRKAAAVRRKRLLRRLFAGIGSNTKGKAAQRRLWRSKQAAFEAAARLAALSGAANRIAATVFSRPLVLPLWEKTFLLETSVF